MAGWGSAASATRGGLRRDAFFFSEERLYASMYRSVPPGRGPALVLCPSWGHEMFGTLPLCYRMARRLAESGGAGLLVHWPGHGDSGGEPERTDLERMAAAAEQALGEARRRVPEPPWGIAGVRLGAAAATLAAVRAEAAALLLIRPALDPGRYFAELERASRRAGLGRVHGRPWAFGHPLPDVRSQPDVQAALAGFSGPTACMGYESDPPGPPAGELEAKRVPGSWESGMKARHGALVDAMLAWTLSSLEPVRA